MDAKRTGRSCSPATSWRSAATASTCCSPEFDRLGPRDHKTLPRGGVFAVSMMSQAAIPATSVPTMRPVSAMPPDDPRRPADEESISASAERARAELHAEIERVRRGVEQMLDEQNAPLNSDLRRELDTIQEDVRRYVKTRIRKSQKRTDRQVKRLEGRIATLEQRLDGLDSERRLAEWRIHSDTERMLDGLLQEVRAIADRLEGPSYG